MSQSAAAAGSALGSIPHALVAGVELLCLDAGNVVIFLDHERLAQVVRGAGFPVTADALRISEGFAKRAAERNLVVSAPFAQEHRPGAGPWGRNMATMLHHAGVPMSAMSAVLDSVWTAHELLNMWNQVPPELPAALSAFRATGGKTALVSNSEGMLEALFQDMPVRAQLDLLLDSGVVGIEKPDPRIFDIALSHFGIRSDRALHLGDTYLTDVLGAQAAKIRCALIDPFDQYEGMHADIPRVPSAAVVAGELTRIRTQGKQAS